MFRLYELYTLYLKKMTSCGTTPTWCLCEKLPRSILHIAPTPEVWCEVCGRRRRPRACLSSSSDEEEKAAVQRQQILAEQRRSEAEARQACVRVKVAMSAKKPTPRGKLNCIKCGGEPKPTTKPKAPNKNNNRLYIGRLGHYRKPQRLQSKPKDEPIAAAPTKQFDIKPTPTAPPPPPSPPPSPSPSPPLAKASESLWEQPSDDMPNLVAFAHEVFNRPLHLRKRQPNFYDNLFVSDFIPLDKPITDSAGGAISKRRRVFGRPLRSHCSRPLPPLSQVLSEILAKPKLRAKGGGLAPKEQEPNGCNTATQFSPFDSYEGPSEDALVVDSARLVLRQSKALHIKQRADLPTTRLSSFESEPSSDCSSSSPLEAPSAPPAERQRHSYTVGAPLRLHEMMKTVAHSGLSDSSASSSSTSSSSHKSAGSTLPVHQQSVRSRGGEEPPYTEDKPAAEPDLLPISIIEKILWLMEQKPAAEAGPAIPLTDDALQHISLMEKQDEHIEHSHTESVKGLLQFMESLHIAEPDANVKNATDEAKIADASGPEPQQHSNDMSNELPLSSTNKSAADAKYAKVFSRKGGAQATAPPKTSSGRTTSMWSVISSLFSSKQGRQSLTDSSVTLSLKEQEMQPLKTAHRSGYGAIETQPAKEILQSNACKQNCSKCGLNRTRKKIQQNTEAINSKGAHKPSCRLNSNINRPKMETEVKQEVPKLSQKQDLKQDKVKLQAAVEDKSPTSRQSATSSTHFESCFGIASPTVATNPATAQLQQLLQQIKADKCKSLKKYHNVQTVETVQYASSELIEPKMVSFSREAMHTGQLQKYFLSPAIIRAPLGMFEFRTPDIQAVKLVNNQHVYQSENTEANSTPIAHSETCAQSDESLATDENRKHVLQKHNQPVWPAHPFRHRKRHIKYKATQLELSYTVSDENMCPSATANASKEHNRSRTRRKRENSEKWIVNEMVQQKITEMMTKPIKLLNLKEETTS